LNYIYSERQKYGINSLKIKQNFFHKKSLDRSILVYKNSCSSTKENSKRSISFLDSDSPFNCLNDSMQILLSYMRNFLRKKIIKLEKINFITNKNKSKNQVGKSNSQMLLSLSFVCVICFTKHFRK
jgi:hypothetical protein